MSPWCLCNAQTRVPASDGGCHDKKMMLMPLCKTVRLVPLQVSAEMYSAPSIVLQSRNPDGSLHVFDDFREAYAWMRYNTPADSKVASWCAIP